MPDKTGLRTTACQLGLEHPGNDGELCVKAHF